MNPQILHSEVQDFIQKNRSADLTKLILKGSPFEKITVQELANQIACKEKSLLKLPTWFQTKNIYYPPKLNLEQSSSETTATYKAGLVKGKHLIDITGGLGVDAFAFSKQFDHVTHCEINTELSAIAAHNFEQLHISNVTTIAQDGLEFLEKNNTTFDCIYIDPSRRNNHKGKVFLLADCLPNVPKHLNFLFTKADTILIKTSPILDITSAINELQHVQEVHIVATEGEVKELLFVLKKTASEAIGIKTINIQKEKKQQFNFTFGTPAESEYSLPKDFLYEPNAAILKSGGFHQVSTQFKLSKLHPHSHLYTSDELIEFPGRIFRIVKTTSYDKKLIKKELKDGKANITTRNFPKTVQQIKKEVKNKDGGSQYLFFTTNAKAQFICLFCEKISSS